MSEYVVFVEQGRLKGKISFNYTGKPFYSFQGIPYAKAPLGQLRFKAPEPPEPWDGIKLAIEEKPGCYAHHIYFNHIVGTEDCLYINVYTPDLPTENATLKPVIVCIHGGAYLKGSGSSEFFGPEFLINQDVVLVTFNYRVGILGFLSLEDSRLGVPGNAGMKDQVMALKWIQSNIRNFNGDPNNVTLLGFSAGGASVQYLMLSPLAKGLFHRGIAHSASALSVFAHSTRKTAEIAQILQLDTTNEEVLLTHLRSLPVQKLLEVQDAVKETLGKASSRAFAPIAELPSNESPFITDKPINIMQSRNYNKVPLIMGVTNNEALLLAPVLKFSGTIDITDFESCIPNEFNVRKGTEMSSIIANEIREFYNEISHDKLDRWCKLRGDSLFTWSTYNAAKLQAQTSDRPVYFYVFSLESRLNTYKQIMNIDFPGASQIDDLGYLFKTAYTPHINGTIEEIYMKKMTMLWTNFAKYDDPNGLDYNFWKPIDFNNFFYLNIDKELRLDVEPFKERMNFWNGIRDLVKNENLYPELIYNNNNINFK